MVNDKVFFIGDVALDEYYSAAYFPKIKEKVIVHTLPSQMGGMIANAACVFASYGTKPSFLTALNSGSISKTLCDGLCKAGVDTSNMVWDDTLPDSKTIIILAENEHTVFIPTLNLQKIDLPDSAMKELCNSNYIYSTFCELRPLSYRGKKVEAVLTEIKKCGCKLWCDLDVADILESDEALFNYVDTLFINEAGYSNLSKFANGDVLPWLFDKGINMVIVTKAENGCSVYLKDGKKISVPGVKVPVVDVTGAGDTFCSSFLYAYTIKQDIELCARFANFAAAQAVTKMGPRAGAIGAKKVLQFIKEHGADASPFEIFI